MPIKCADRAATRRYCFDCQGRIAQANTSDSRLELIVEIAVIAGRIGAGASHVERQDLRVAQLLPDPCRAYHAAGRTAQ